MKQTFIKDLKPGQQIINTPFVVIKAEKKVAKNGKEYMDVTLGDASGTLIAKIWNEKYDACSVDALKEGVVVSTNGSVTEFNGKVQMVLTMAILTEDYAEEDFVPVTKKDIDDMMTTLHGYINNISDKNLKTLLKTIFNDESFVKVFKKTPAAMKLHHAYVGGLLEHILELLAFAKPMYEIYQCNTDLVTAGIILHDIGKVEEIIWRNMAIEYSEKGKLLGHIQIGINILERYKQQDFNPECWQLLVHIILSHHGKLEYGASVIPATIEAKIVSLSDDASAKLRGYQSLLDDAQDNGDAFSEYSKTLETMIYRRQYESES